MWGLFEKSSPTPPKSFPIRKRFNVLLPFAFGLCKSVDRRLAMCGLPIAFLEKMLYGRGDARTRMRGRFSRKGPHIASPAKIFLIFQTHAQSR